MDTSYLSSMLQRPGNPVHPKPPCVVARAPAPSVVARAPAPVKNKSASAIQISAEQLLRDARVGRESEFRPPNGRIVDQEELSEYRLRKRKEFEHLVRNPRDAASSAWLKYARWEEAQHDMARARSVFERALDASSHRDHAMWINYSEFEMRNRFVSHARNVWDRAVSCLPRVDQLWYKYVHMEELLGAVSNARQVFERWTAWRPSVSAWKSYVNFELRYGEVDRARAIYERFARDLLLPDTFIQYAKFEMQQGEVTKARRVYEHALDVLDPVDEGVELLLLSFAKFEEKCSETDRARAIYRYGIHQLPKSRTEELYNSFLLFEKMYGDASTIDYVIVCKRRFKCEDEVTMNPSDYDSWFDYIRLEESVGDMDRIRQVFARAVAILPPAEEKRYWKRYIYIWIMHALYEELDVHDIDRARDVYKDCLKLIPHRKFSFTKVWLLAAQFEIRQKNLKAARQILGNAIGMAPKGNLFKKYIEIELQLGNIDRCRILYERYIQWAPENCYAWRKYAELEKSLSETDRVRSIYELAIAQPALDTPEVLWKDYLQFEVDENELDKTRQLYEKLLDRTKHLKVWISYAEFEASAGLGSEKTDCQEGKNDTRSQDSSIEERVQRSRAVFERAFNYFSTSAPELHAEKAMLLKAWYNKEISFGHTGDVGVVRSKVPRKVKRKRLLVTVGSSSSESDDEYISDFFAEELATHDLKILEAAYEWKKHKKTGDSGNTGRCHGTLSVKTAN